MALQPSFRFTLYLAKYPASAGTTTYRWSTRPFADAGAWSEGRLISVGPIDRACTDQDGNYELAKLRVELTDDDALIRGLLADPTTLYMTAREAMLELLSETGRHAGTAWRTVFRGRVTDVQATKGRRASIEVTDLVGSHFSGFDLDKTIGVSITAAEWPNLPASSSGRIYSILFGEESDAGSVDANGNASDKGMIPITDLGDYTFTGDVTPATGSLSPTDAFSGSPPTYLSAPTGLSASIVGTPGTREVRYAVSALSDYGETLLSDTLVVSNSPNEPDATNFVRLSWTAVDGATQYRLWGRSSGSPDQYLGLTTGTSLDDTGLSEQSVGVPVTNTALTGTGTYGVLAVAIGALSDIQAIYASDLATGGTPKRVRMEDSVYGSEFLVPGKPGWPYSTNYIERNGIRQTVIFARGPRLKQHRDGTVTIAVNLCGREDVGDSSGVMVDEAFKALQLMINEDVLKHAGTGYRTGNWGPLETYQNGDPQVQTTQFAAMQALTVDRIGGRGYLAAWAITEPITLREFVRRFCLTFDCRLAVNHHGQIYPILIDDMSSSTAGRIYRDRFEVKHLEDQTLAHDEVEDRLTFDYDWDADAKKYRIIAQVLEDANTIAAMVPGGVVGDNDKRGVREGDTQELFCTRHRATAYDSRARRLGRNKRAPRYVPIVTNLAGLEDDLGAQIRLTHYDGLGVNGDDKTPMIVLRHRINPMTNETMITGLDLARLTGTAFPLLGDKATIAGNLFNKASGAEPPTGAYTLR